MACIYLPCLYNKHSVFYGKNIDGKNVFSIPSWCEWIIPQGSKFEEVVIFG